jgi:antitoxin FitA
MKGAMTQTLVRSLEDKLKVCLQRRAKRHGRSTEEEAFEILGNAPKEDDAPKVKFVTTSVSLFSGSGIDFEESIAEVRGMRMQIPDFESGYYSA